jgi:hypothetical protein
MNFLGRFSKIRLLFLYEIFSAEGQTERGTDIMNRISQFRYATTNALHIYISPAKFLTFLQRLEPISYYCLSGQHSYTRGPLADTSDFSSYSHDLKFSTEFNHSESHCCIIWLHFLLYQYNCLSDTSNLLQATERTVI